MTKTFNDLLNEIDRSADTQRDRGTMFERLIRAYLRNEPTYHNLYRHVWMLKDVPDELGISKQDTGVDLVAEQFDGSLTAVQVKLNGKKQVAKGEINSFIAELGKNYYQHGMLVTTTDFDYYAKSTISDNDKDISVIGKSDLEHSAIDWSQFDFSRPEHVTLKSHKRLYDYQKKALGEAISYYRGHDRGQMIMAPGTGKTFTSLKIAEAMAQRKEGQFRILYLVPSIQLLTQTLRGWNRDTNMSMTSMAITSDRDASRDRSDNEAVKGDYIGYPATTSYGQVLDDWRNVQAQDDPADLLVTFSTYQSIDVMGKAQKEGFPDFDLIVADEAHRTTGAHVLGEDASFFTKVHSNDNVRATKRLYQTATPKIYGDKAQKNAKDRSIVLSSMDDKDKFGEVFYRLGFGQAITYGILTDYKVMTLAIDENALHHNLQREVADKDNGLALQDIQRIIGVWNGMMRRSGYQNPDTDKEYMGPPLQRAIAFTNTIQDSKKVAKQYESVIDDYLEHSPEPGTHLKMRHADGKMSAVEKNDTIDWLSGKDKPDDEARVVSNAKFLTEGVDIPTLDAIIFLAAKSSPVDIVQAVGRIMRKAPGKDYGYIILPILIPKGEKPEDVLDNRKDYEVVWQVINALRSVDERFESIIDTINTNPKKRSQVINNRFPTIGVGEPPKKDDTEGDAKTSSTSSSPSASQPQGPQSEQQELFDWDQYRTAIYGKIVQKVGNRHYLDNWSHDVANIAQHQMRWIKDKLKDKDDPIYAEFQNFVESLRYNINDGIDADQAVEMLSQHLITKPIFDALFNQYDFVRNNPVSRAMESMIKELEDAGFMKEQQSLTPLYESVKIMAEGVEKPEDRQKIIVTLYNKFFKTAFQATTQKLGITFTPIEVVDFIVHSVDYSLKKYLDSSLIDDNVHVLDPFTGTGTFIVRTLQFFKGQLDKGEITLADIARKYAHDLHANEIVLLSYYIATINIESTYNEISHNDEYKPFNGMVFTDTFESTEYGDTLNDDMFGDNNQRLKQQQRNPITVIMSNPPYSKGKFNANDAGQNVTYPKLENNIRDTYGNASKVSNTVSLYNSYIKAIRWSSNRIKDKGIIGFVTAGGFLTSAAADGLRKCLYNEFNHLFIFNLKGSHRGTISNQKKQGTSVFGQGTMSSVAISILIKDNSNIHEIKYKDIDDYLDKEQKLSVISNYHSIDDINWKNIVPDNNNDWLNKMNPNFKHYMSLNKKDEASVFPYHAMGVKTNRDTWVYGFSKDNVSRNVNVLVNHYNNERLRINPSKNLSSIKELKGQLNNNPKYISWSNNLIKELKQNKLLKFDASNFVLGMYRPFIKKWLYYDKSVVEAPRLYYAKFGGNNRVIYTTGRGTKYGFSVIATNLIPDNQLNSNGQGFMNYDNEQTDNTLFTQSNDNINQSFANKLGLNTDDAFYYIYGILNSNEYQNKYKNDLIKDFARIPIVRNVQPFVDIGKKLMDLHLHYEDVAPYRDVDVEYEKDDPSYHVTKMKHPSPQRKNWDIIEFNDDITIKGVPMEAYDYVVNGKPVIEWIVQQYQVRKDKKSGIVDDPNQFSEDPKYIFKLLLRIINVSMQTVDLVNSLPKMDIIDESKPKD